MFTLKPIDRFTGSSESSKVNMTDDDLKGWEEIPRDEWLNLERGTQVRCVKTTGGIIKSMFINSKSIDKRQLYLVDNMNSVNPFRCNIGIDKISRLWRKDNTEDLQSIARIVESLSKKVQSMESNDFTLNDKSMNEIHISQLTSEVTKLSVRVDNIEYNIRKIHESLAEVIKKINTDLT